MVVFSTVKTVVSHPSEQKSLARDPGRDQESGKENDDAGKRTYVRAEKTR
jgi:hypothetical protein